MGQPRFLGDVIGKILPLIPEEEATAALRGQLKSIRDSAAYAPPEYQPEWWHEGADALFAFFEGKEPATEWGRKIKTIWIGQ